ncbi:hypothetical protein CR956_00125 [Candidatus Saccharibacteria bacterium]|nr:MAG: hypothetical protein CR956_00125 [Candidatus Saccharibacteria bacterium]
MEQMSQKSMQPKPIADQLSSKVAISTETASDKKLAKLVEILDPENLPEVGFQSYIKFANDSITKRSSFLEGEVINPSFEYCELVNLEDLQAGITNLESAKEEAAQLEPSLDSLNAINSTLDFRVAEMEYVKQIAQLNKMTRLLERLDDETSRSNLVTKIEQLVEDVRNLGHELYGEPDPDIRDMALNELWSILDSKSYSSSMQEIYNELQDGFWFNDNKFISPLMRADNRQVKLPDPGDLSIDWMGKYVAEMNGDIQALVEAYWEQAVAQFGWDYKCGPEDIAEVFQRTIDMRDPNGESNVTVRLAEGRASLSWESPEKAVLVGSNREPIGSKDELFKKVLHEFGVHGQRLVNGLKTDLPVLATGLYTDTERADYLTFEEGFATTVEETIGDSTPRWNAGKLGHYLNISMAEDGADFRSVFEMSWRYRLLASLKDNEEPTESEIARQKKLAYGSCVRIFRGTQPDLAEKTGFDIPPLTFNKDLAYLSGRVLAMQHIKHLYDDENVEGLMLLFGGKFDPTIPKQHELAKRHIDLSKIRNSFG